MSKTHNDGGPAYPHDGQANYTGSTSLRDWFAGLALQAHLTFEKRHEGTFQEFLASEASIAYQFADAMLEEREKLSQ